jgi:hypothetical protein
MPPRAARRRIALQGRWAAPTINIGQNGSAVQSRPRESLAESAVSWDFAEVAWKTPPLAAWAQAPPPKPRLPPGGGRPGLGLVCAIQCLVSPVPYGLSSPYRARF